MDCFRSGNLNVSIKCCIQSCRVVVCSKCFLNAIESVLQSHQLKESIQDYMVALPARPRVALYFARRSS